jgi:hypothetical protein
VPADDPTDFYEWELDQAGVVDTYESDAMWLDWELERRAPTIDVRYRRCIQATGLCEEWSHWATYHFKADGDTDDDGVIGASDWHAFGKRFGKAARDFYLCADPGRPGPPAGSGPRAP